MAKPCNVPRRVWRLDGSAADDNAGSPALMSVANPLAVPRRGLGPACPVTVRDQRECGEPVPRTGDLVRTKRAERPVPQRSGGHGPRRDRRTHEVPGNRRRCRQACPPPAARKGLRRRETEDVRSRAKRQRSNSGEEHPNAGGKQSLEA